MLYIFSNSMLSAHCYIVFPCADYERDGTSSSWRTGLYCPVDGGVMFAHYEATGRQNSVQTAAVTV